MKENRLNVAFLTTYPPRECGIATFTQDLVNELKKSPRLNIGIIAISDKNLDYGGDVISQLGQYDRKCYADTAEKINVSGIDLVVVEHEYGIYGGECGEYLLDFAGRLKKPMVTTLHTVLSAPNGKQKDILCKLCEKSSAIVTMAGNSIKTLEDVYGADHENIALIHHGVPSVNFPERQTLKKEMGLENRTVISTFGLLGPGKGIEYGIKAVARTAAKHPDVLYMILGKTHPVIRRHSGEAYRESLEKLVRESGAAKNVRFVNRYLTKEEIMKYLKLSDIYMTPYLGKEQAVSGTLAYAVGSGRVIVSTPYAYAREMLAEGRGLLADFRNAKSLSEQLNYIIEHPEQKEEMERKTMTLGRTMTWAESAKRYADMFFKVCAQEPLKEKEAV